MGKRKLRWMKLDNAGKIYPAAKRRNWNNLFRISATLTEPVDRAILRDALEAVIPRFPSIAVRLRTGVFWYYLEEIPAPPAILDEGAAPLEHHPFDDLRKCAFRVLVYENRIAVEIFHTLTDGNGGMIFVKTLVAEYLRRKYGVTIPAEQGVADLTEEPTAAELEDSFLKNSGTVSARAFEPTAYHVSGTPEPDVFRNAVTLSCDLNEFRRVAGEHHATVTEFLTAALMTACLRVQKQEPSPWRRKLPVRILVPVNLRKLFGSRTLRNFVLYVTPTADPRLGEYDLDELCALVHHTIALEYTEKQMRPRITANVRPEQMLILKIMPLFVKNIAMKAAFDRVGDRTNTLCLSNLGLVRLPAEMERYVTRMDFVIGVPARGSNNCGVLGYGDRLYINFIRNIREPLIEAQMQQVLAQLGIRVRAESNGRD